MFKIIQVLYNILINIDVIMDGQIIHVQHLI